MKTLLLITAILAVTVGFPVSEDQDREKRSISDSDENTPQIFLPPFQNPLGPYPLIINQAYPGYRFYLFPFPVSQLATATPPPNEK
ncbi:follicular dendritic cell secreted peptide [Heterocephalus glaber]|uniref:Follicular dendritic cell secreted peptide n=1 Tax=Heterocephalus glaber TaxID=10181 RepID=A0AAX6S927_HETGA|nr:follicular dendritic cell secreted peptide [Heterocephalus glaber]